MTIVDCLMRIGLSLFLSFLIGYERENQEKSAGLRDIMLITLGATAIAIFTFRLLEISNVSGGSFDLIRAIAYYLVALGFVGGGIITKYKNKLEGITTSTLLLPTAIMGFFCGIGDYLLSTVLAIVIYFILKIKYIRVKIIKSKR